MAGHSHWAGIKHRKAAQDKKRSKYFSKFSKAITIAAKDGGGDPEKNLKLRYAIDKAKAGNMPNAGIDRAIKKATGADANVIYEEILYEGYAPGGVAIIAEILTENRNRTAPAVRSIFKKNGGNMGNSNSVAFMFDRKGLIAVKGEGLTEDEVFEAAADAGAEDVEAAGEEFAITTGPVEFEGVKRALVAKGWELTTAELAWVPQTSVTPSVEAAAKVEALIEALEDDDDVQAVHTNFSPPE